MLKVVMAKGRKLKKGGGDLETQKQNVASLEQTVGKQNADLLQLRLKEQNVAPLELRPREQNVALSKLKIDELNNSCGLELTMVIMCNSNDEITPNLIEKWWVKCFKSYIHQILF